MRAPPLAINDLEPPDSSSYALSSVNLSIPFGQGCLADRPALATGILGGSLQWAGGRIDRSPDLHACPRHHPTPEQRQPQIKAGRDHVEQHALGIMLAGALSEKIGLSWKGTSRSL